MNLLFSINQKCVSLLQTCLQSIALQGGDTVYHVYVFHSDLTEEDIMAIKQLGLDGMSYQFIAIPKNMFADFPVTKRYPEQIYYRLAAPFLLPEQLDRILYLDVDLIVINSLLPLYKSDFGDNWFMACTHTGEYLTRLNRIRLGLDPDQEVPYINTGVLLINLSALRAHTSLETIRQYAADRQNVLLLPDQDILTALYGDKVKLLDSMIYNLSDRILKLYNADPRNEKIDLAWVRKNSVIIHYFGRNKPWHDVYAGILDVFYRETLETLQARNGRRTNP